MIPSGMNMNGTPLFPVTRYVAAWPPATAVSGAEAATMKNTRSGTPSARRWSPPPAAGALGGAGASMVAMGLSSTPIADEVRQRPRGFRDRGARDALVDAVDL